jgi:hypothetical protein
MWEGKCRIEKNDSLQPIKDRAKRESKCRYGKNQSH